MDPFDTSNALWVMTTRRQGNLNTTFPPNIRYCLQLNLSRKPTCNNAIRAHGLACKSVFNCNAKWLKHLKRLVRQSGLNCRSGLLCRERNECERWYLRKLRATYTINPLRAATDAQAVSMHMIMPGRPTLVEA